MVNPPNVNPAQSGANSPENISKAASNNMRPISQTPDEGRRRPFKEVLNKKEDKGRTPLVKKASEEDEDEPGSPLELAAQTLIRKSKPSPSITDTAIFSQDADPEQEEIESPTGRLVANNEEATPNTINLFQKPQSNSKSLLIDENEDANHPLNQFLAAQKAQKEREEQAGVDINLAAAPQNAPQGAAIVNAKPAPENVNKAREELFKLAEVMLERIQQVTGTEPGRTDTTLFLKYPPTFAGVSVTITEYSSSQKQFSVTFAGLENNPQAQLLLQMPKNQDELRQALFAKGYTLRLITLENKVPGLRSTEPTQIASNDQKRREAEAQDASDDDASLA